MTHSSLSRVTDTRIEGRVQHVDNEVAHYENQHEQRDDGHHQVCLALQNGLVGEEADAVLQRVQPAIVSTSSSAKSSAAARLDEGL